MIFTNMNSREWISKPFRSVEELSRSSRRGRGAHLKELVEKEKREEEEELPLSKKASEHFTTAKLQQMAEKLRELEGRKEEEVVEKTKEVEIEREGEGSGKEEVCEEGNRQKKRKRASSRKSIYYSIFQETSVPNQYRCCFPCTTGSLGSHRHSETFMVSRTNRFEEHLNTWHPNIIKFMVEERGRQHGISDDQLVHEIFQKFPSPEGTIVPFTVKMDIFAAEWERWINLAIWVTTKNIPLRALDDNFFRQYHLSIGREPLPSRQKVSSILMTISIDHLNIKY